MDGMGAVGTMRVERKKGRGREEGGGRREERRKGRRSRGACRAKSSRLGDSVAWGTGDARSCSTVR